MTECAKSAAKAALDYHAFSKPENSKCVRQNRWQMAVIWPRA